MENEYGMVGALVGVAIIVVGFILVVFLRDIQERTASLNAIKKREKEKLDKIKKLGEMH